MLHRLRVKLDVMAELGTTTLLACSNVRPDSVDDPELTAEQLHAVGELAAERGVTVAFEALAWGRHVNRLAQAWEAVAPPTTRRSRWRWTPSTCWPAGTTARHWPASRATGSDSSRSPTPRCCG